MLEIGTTFRYQWDSDDCENYDEEVTIAGYIYYEARLYYVCVGESGATVDVHEQTVREQVTYD